MDDNFIENEFINLYKRTENLLNDLYRLISEPNGSILYQYEKMMEKNRYEGIRYIEDWDYIYRHLHHVRLLRNSYAHDLIPEEIKEEDYDFIEYFHDLLINAKDPIALLNKKHRQNEKENKIRTINACKETIKHKAPGSTINACKETIKYKAPEGKLSETENTAGIALIVFFLIFSLILSCIFLI